MPTRAAPLVYSASYDAWGNRSTGGVTATISYDTLNRQVEYNAGSTSQEWYVYDASGNRVLKRSISGSTTTLTGYAYGLQELTYTGTGTLSSQLDYYSIAGHLIGSTNGTTTSYDLTDAQGSVLATFSASAIQGEQNYGPYGNQRYTQGTIGTDKGYTGQSHDAVSGLDYYNARYYDPVAGIFLSPDVKQGNTQGMNPYAYVGGNPTTRTDPTGQRYVDSQGDYANIDPSGDLALFDRYPALTSTTGYIYQMFFYTAKVARQPISKGSGGHSISQALGIPIKAASEILFNISRDGINPGSLTAQEFQYVMENSDILAKTIFLFGETY